VNPEVNDWLDIVGNVWIGFVLIAVAAVPSFYAHRNHKSITDIKQQASDIKAQVVNGHTSPMREDLDKALIAITALGNGLRKDFESLAHDVHNLRKDLAMEEGRRRVQIQDLALDVDRMRRRP
jgi:hypothetical protein